MIQSFPEFSEYVEKNPKNFPPISSNKEILRMSLVFIQFLFPVNHLFFWSTKNTQDVTGFYLMFVSSESPFF